MTQYANSFEGGTSGTTITAGNSGGVSGDAFDTVVVDATCSLTFDNTHAAHGLLAMRVQNGATSGTAQGTKQFPAASTTVAVRFYIYMTASPGATITVCRLQSTATTRSSISVNTSRKLFLRDQGGGTVILQTAAIPLNQWVRVEAQWNPLSATVGQATLSRFDTADSSTVTETATSAASFNFGGSADRVQFGSVTSVASVGPFWIDDIAQNDTAAAIGAALAAALTSEDVLAASLDIGATPLNAASITSEALLAAVLSAATTSLNAASLTSEAILAASLTVDLPLSTWTGDDNLRFDAADEMTAYLWLEPTEVSPPAGTHVSDYDVVSVTLPSPTAANGVPVGWTPTVGRSKWGRYQIVVGGTDVTHWRGKRSQVRSYAFNEPFGDADATLVFPQITEFDDLSTVPWWKEGAEVTIRRRHPEGSKTHVWEGLLASEEPGRVAHCIGALYQLDLMVRPRTFWENPWDVGQRIAHQINTKGRHHGMKVAYCDIVTTGIETRERGAGDPILTSFIQNILATAMSSDGKQWTLALQHPRKPVVKLKRYPADGIDWTVDNGAPGVTPSLSLDYTTADNVEFGQGADGDCVWENRRFPNLHPDDAPLYPLTLPATFVGGDGHTGFAPFAAELGDNGYQLDSDDTYLSSDVDEIERFQDDAGITVDGIVGPQTWAAAYQNGRHQGDLEGTWVQPLALDRTVEPYLYNARGARIGNNPRWDPSKLRIEKMTLFGDRVSKKRGIASAKQLLARDKTPAYLGSLVLTSDPQEGSRRDIAAGQNIRLRHWRDGHVDLHIARAEWDELAGSMSLTVDEKARDLMTVAQVYQRNRDVADPVGRPKPGWRTGTQVSDRVQWACEDGTGVIPFHAQQAGLWSVLRVPTGQVGTVAKVTLAAGSGLTRSTLKALLSDPLPDGYHSYAIPGAAKLAVAIFDGHVSPNMLANLLGNPLQNDGGGNNPWDANADQLRDWGCQYAAGGPLQAGGFYPHTDPGDGSSTGLTGRFVDAAGWPFEAEHAWMWVAIYATATCYVGGRMYPGAPS